MDRQDEVKRCIVCHNEMFSYDSGQTFRCGHSIHKNCLGKGVRDNLIEETIVQKTTHEHAKYRHKCG